MLSRAGGGKVLLFLPPYQGAVFGPPLGLLSLASSLRQAGFEPRIIDGALTPDFQTAICQELKDCLAFGVSLLTGPMIRDAITASELYGASVLTCRSFTAAGIPASHPLRRCGRVLSMSL